MLLVALLALVALPSAAPAYASGDDYPYSTDTTQSADPWGFTKRQCVSFVAWRFAQVGQPLNNSAEHWGDASQWDDTARSRGVAVAVNPRVGAVAQWNASESSRYYANGSATPNGTFTAGAAGHVAYVTQVYADNSVLVEQYNLSGNRSFSTMHVTAPRYVYLPG